MTPAPQGTVLGWLLRWAAGVRFPVLLGLMAAVFFVDLLIPDFLPFVDEALLGLFTLALAALRKPRPPEPPA